MVKITLGTISFQIKKNRQGRKEQFYYIDHIFVRIIITSSNSDIMIY